MRVAIMQPYFFPYLGYFRLFARADVFVVLDTVQFPRRGWVHRNRLLTAAREPAWLTLPLVKTARESSIAEQALGPGANAAIAERCRRFPALRTRDAALEAVHHELFDTRGTFVDYLVRQMAAVCAALGLTTPMLRASEIAHDDTLAGAARLIAIARALDANTYLNAAGGRALYDAEDFSCHGLKLEFLPDYAGPAISILQRLTEEPAAALRREVREAA